MYVFLQISARNKLGHMQLELRLLCTYSTMSYFHVCHDDEQSSSGLSGATSS